MSVKPCWSLCVTVGNHVAKYQYLILKCKTKHLTKLTYHIFLTVSEQTEAENQLTITKLDKEAAVKTI